MPEKQENTRNQNLVGNQIKCKKASEEYAKTDPENLVAGNNVLEKEQYFFSDKLNTCLYRKEWSFYSNDGPLITHNYSVIDIYSNKIIVNLFQHFDSTGKINNSNGQEEVYNSVVKEYFKE